MAFQRKLSSLQESEKHVTLTKELKKDTSNTLPKVRTLQPSFRDSSLPENDEETVNKILKHYGNHPTASKIKHNQNETLNFDFPTAKVEDTTKIIKSLN